MPVFLGMPTAAAAATRAGVGVGTKALIGLSAAGTATQAYGQYQAGKQAQAVAKTQAAWNRYNAEVGRRQAEAEQTAADFESRQQRKRSDELKARLRARRGASGVTQEGSPLLAEENLAAELALEEQNIRLRGGQRVAKLKSLSILDISRESAAKSRAKGLGRAAGITAGSTLLAGGANTFLRARAVR